MAARGSKGSCISVIEMWRWIKKCESMLFYPVFLLYASLRSIPYSGRCSDCGRRLWEWEYCRTGLCEECELTGAKSTPQLLSNDAYSGQIAANVLLHYGQLYGELQKRLGSGRILDVGCGTGYLLARLESSDRQLQWMDKSAAAVKAANARAVRASVYVADARSLPLRSDSFDWLICAEVLEHISEDSPVGECFRVLKPGGRALFTVPNGRGIGGRQVGHVRYFSFHSFCDYVRRAGFALTSARRIGLHVPILTYAFQMLAYAANRDIPFAHPWGVAVPEFLATNFVVECRKPRG